MTDVNDTSIDGFSGSLMFMDTDREKEIYLGPKWPFEQLNEGECITGSGWAEKYDVAVDEEVVFNV